MIHDQTTPDFLEYPKEIKTLPWKWLIHLKKVHNDLKMIKKIGDSLMTSISNNILGFAGIGTIFYWDNI